MSEGRTASTPTVLGWTLTDLRTRAESSAKAECRRGVCHEPEMRELAAFVLALIDKVETLTRDGVLRGK